MPSSHHLDILLNELASHVWAYVFLALVVIALFFTVGAGAFGIFRTRRPHHPLTS